MLAMLDEDLRIRSEPQHKTTPEITIKPPASPIVTVEEAVAKGLSLSDLFPTLFPPGSTYITDDELKELAQLRSDADDITEQNTLANSSSLGDEARQRRANQSSDEESDEDRYAGPDIGLPGEDSDEEESPRRAGFAEKRGVHNDLGDATDKHDDSPRPMRPIDNAFDESSSESSDEEEEAVSPKALPPLLSIDVAKAAAADDTVKIEEPEHTPPTPQSPVKRRQRLITVVEDAVLDFNRCIISLTHGDYKAARSASKRPRRYLVATDLSEESLYALEWAIGTVIREGDELVVVNVIEDEDVANNPDLVMNDRVKALRTTVARKEAADKIIQHAQELVEQTRLKTKITAEVLHAADAKHMMLDIIDYLEPTLVLVGSRGMTGLKGILLGSFSHYLVYKSSVPVMVARRKLKKASKKNRRPKVATQSLTDAKID